MITPRAMKTAGASLTKFDDYARVTNKTAICAQAPIAVFTMPMRGYAFVTLKLHYETKSDLQILWSIFCFHLSFRLIHFGIGLPDHIVHGAGILWGSTEYSIATVTGCSETTGIFPVDRQRDIRDFRCLTEENPLRSHGRIDLPVVYQDCNIGASIGGGSAWADCSAVP